LKESNPEGHNIIATFNRETAMSQIHEDLICEYCDLYEDAFYGFSPSSERIENLRGLTAEQIQAECEWLRDQIRAEAKAMQERMEEEKRWEEAQQKLKQEQRENEEWVVKWEGYYKRLCTKR